MLTSSIHSITFNHHSEEIGPTAVRELEEELGLTGPLVEKLEHLFTLACTNKGETKRHGSFTCNEFQELMILPVGPTHDLSSYKYPPGEVTDVSRVDAPSDGLFDVRGWHCCI